MQALPNVSCYGPCHTASHTLTPTVSINSGGYAANSVGFSATPLSLIGAFQRTFVQVDLLKVDDRPERPELLI